MSYFGVYVLFAFFLLGFIINSFKGTCNPCAPCAKMSWFVLSLFSIFGFLLSSILLPVVVVAIEGCDTLHQLINNETFYNQTVNLLGAGAAAEYVSVCFYTPDGNLLEKLGVQDQLSLFDTIKQGIQDAGQFFDIDIPDSLVIPEQESLINQYKNGLLPVNSYVANQLNALNQFTDYNSPGTHQSCHEAQDTWVLNSANCSSPGYTVFINNGNPSQGYGQKECIGFDQYKTDGSSRYGGKFTGCPNQGSTGYSAYVSSYVNKFQSHMTSVNNVFDQLLTDLSTLNQTNKNFMIKAKEVLNPIMQFNTTAYAILDIISNNDTGLINNLNCKFIKTQTNQVIDGVCSGFLTNVFLVVALALGLGIVSLITILPVYCLSNMSSSKHTEHSFQDGTSIEFSAYGKNQVLLGHLP